MMLLLWLCFFICPVGSLAGGTLEQHVQAAGVLPFAQHEGTLYVLLGRENGDQAVGSWCDFGGWSDGQVVLKAAIAEFLEETNHAYGDAQSNETYESIETWVRNNNIEKYLLVRFDKDDAQKICYVMVPLLVVYKDPQSILDAPCLDKEKDAFAWIKASNFLAFFQSPSTKHSSSLFVDVTKYAGVVEQHEPHIRNELLLLCASEENQKKFAALIALFSSFDEHAAWLGELTLPVVLSSSTYTNSIN